MFTVEKSFQHDWEQRNFVILALELLCIDSIMLMIENVQKTQMCFKKINKNELGVVCMITWSCGSKNKMIIDLPIGISVHLWMVLIVRYRSPKTLLMNGGIQDFLLGEVLEEETQLDMDGIIRLPNSRLVGICRYGEAVM